MKIRLLGTAAGGGFPQWNCGCDGCRAARRGDPGAVTRTQSCAAVSADGRRWFLLNASPDIRVQIESFPPLACPPDARRGTGIEGVLVTNADLDHVLGLFVLREGRPIPIHATSAVRAALTEGLGLERTLSCYCGLEWRDPPMNLTPLPCADGSPSGLLYAALPLAGKPPKYREPYAPPSEGDCVGYLLVDEATGGRLIYAPDLAALDNSTLEQLCACDLLLIDGTFWSEEEMHLRGVGETPAARMGHLPLGGVEGSLARLASRLLPHVVFVHINNTNPILLAGTMERAAVETAGCEVGYDGQELEL